MNFRRALAAAASLLLLSARAHAYRPFVSTDADVAAFRTIELEMGYFALARDDGRTHGQTPQTVVNYGFRPGFEAVGQFFMDEPPNGPARVIDAELSVKNVLRRGVLQEAPGPSVAMESVLLLPGSAEEEQPRAGWEESAILSHKLADMTFHWNGSLGADQTAGLPFAAWGLIAEKPLFSGVRAVSEYSGEDARGRTPDNSVLFGFIWSSGWRDADFDFGARRGLSAVSSAWSVTAGISIPFAVGPGPR
jgi:hypothetical protein